MLPAVEPMKKILLASASTSLLNRNMNLLKRRGFQLLTATSGKEALECQRQHGLDLILADLVLGDMDGDTLCSLVRSEGNVKDVAVIIICNDVPENLARVAQSSANGMIVRPIKPEQLVETVGNFLAVQMVRSKRVDLHLKVEVSNSNAGGEFSCLSRDISNSGILLETDCRLEPGSRLFCRFTMPHAARIEAKGVVARHVMTADARNQYGVQFIDLPAAYGREIDSFVSRYSG